MTAVPADFIEDWPASAPAFDFDLIAESLVPVLQQPTEGALVLGIHGSWGSGKTTLMQAVSHALGAGQADVKDVFVDFNAWKYNEREALWRALILRLIAELRQLVVKDEEEQLEELERSLYRAFIVQEKGPWAVNWQSLVTEVITIGLSVIRLDFVGRALARSASWVTKLFPSKKNGDGLDAQSIEQLGSILERTTTARHVEQVQSIEQFLDKFRQIMDKLRQDDRRVYVLIDDLDRCLPDAALDIFESIKLFLDAPCCVFIVALDRDVIRKGLRLRYGGVDGESALLIDPDQYIEKTISISYDLPRLSETDVRSIIDGFHLPTQLTIADKNLIISGLGTNPRRIKRFMNTLSVQLRLARLAYDRGRPLPPGLLDGDHPGVLSLFVKLLVISYRYSALFALTVEDEEVLVRIERVANKNQRSERESDLRTESPPVRALAADEQFWELMRSQPQFRQVDDTTRALMRWFRQEVGATG